MKRIPIILLVNLLLFSPLISSAQQKYEREYRIDPETIAQEAKNFIISIEPDSKIKWYREISLNTVSIEAKFEKNKKKFSIEFDTLGVLQDVEYVVKRIEIPLTTLGGIKHNLDSLYQKWKFRKIQKHFRGKQNDLLNAIQKNEDSNSLSISYEIVLKGKTRGNTRGNTFLYEIMFDVQGKIEEIQQIIQDKADHLEY